MQSIVIFLLFLSLTQFCNGSETKYSKIVISVKKGAIGTERVVGFKFEIISGRILTVADMPAGWTFKIVNGASWNSTVEASVEVGAAALDVNNFMKYLTNN